MKYVSKQNIIWNFKHWIHNEKKQQQKTKYKLMFSKSDSARGMPSWKKSKQVGQWYEKVVGWTLAMTLVCSSKKVHCTKLN